MYPYELWWSRHYYADLGSGPKWDWDSGLIAVGFDEDVQAVEVRMDIANAGSMGTPACIESCLGLYHFKLFVF